LKIKIPSSINLFLSVGIAFFFLILISLPGFAVTSKDNSTPLSSANTPTLLSVNPDNNYLSQNTWILPEDRITENSPFPSILSTDLFILTETITLTPTDTATPTFIPAPIITSTETPTPRPTTFAWLPLLSNDHFIPTNTPIPTPPLYEVLYCDNLGQPYSSDNYPNGINDNISISDGRQLVNLSIYLNIDHTWVGDLVITLTNTRTGEKTSVLDRPGVPNSQYGCEKDNIISILDDAAAQPAENKCASAPAISGIFLPNESLSTFTGKGIAGTWKLNVSDHSPNDDGWLNHWCLQAFLSDTIPAPTPTPTPVSLPSSAFVYGMSGENQQLRLDCESRSAVDWARHFGFNIGELDFLSQLPDSDDPEAGFVGNPNGLWGQIPPNDYGVHAPPVAEVLRDYGAVASSYRSLQWDDLRAEIASGNPVIVWIIGGSSYNLVNGIPHFYTASSTDNTTIVAHYEHTVIVVGYTPNYVTVLNGSRFVDVPIEQFLDSWSVLQFMAVLARP
jgi:subtilisin-like proprotein convertase family protein/uncharacterized protein YvpB